MGVDYCVAIVDWSAYTRTLDQIASNQLSSDEKSELWLDFEIEHTSESDSLIQGSYYCNHNFGRATQETYLGIRTEISGEQRMLLDHFLSSVLPDYFYYGNPLETSGLKEPVDVDRKHLEETSIAALSPISVQQLFNETWLKIQLEDFEATVAAALGGAPLDTFESVSDFVDYIREWAKLVQFAATNSMGVLVSVG